MKKLVLTLAETRELKRDGVIDIVRNGQDIHIERNEYSDIGYDICIINNYDKIVLAKEPKIKQRAILQNGCCADNTITFIGAEFKPNKMHVYDVKTTGKHPVHIVEGGSYITEDKRVWDESSDLGWYWLNQKEYDYFKSQCKQIIVKI